MKKHVDKYFFGTLVIIIVLFIHRENLNRFPSNMHAWAQSDRYALAIGFIKNDFNFFKPQTFNLVESPDHLLIAKETSITGVDFPIHEYVVAIFMKVFGTTSPWVFRVYTLLYSIIGAYFLLLLSQIFISNKALRFGVIIFYLTSPVFVYYQIGFLPTITSLSNFFIASYFYFKYQKTENYKHFYIGILFFTLSALSRTTFSIFLIAAFCMEFLNAIAEKKIRPKKVSAFALSFLILIGYYLYNQYLNKEYSAAFLGDILPAENLLQVKQIILMVFDKWHYQYFTVYHFIVVALLAITSVFFLIKKKPEKSKVSLFLYGLISFTGATIFFILMIMQYIKHDYYFLDTFFGPIIILVVFMSSLIKIERKSLNILASTIVITFFILSLIQVAKVQKARRVTGYWSNVEHTIENFKDSNMFLDSENIPATSKILVFNSYSSNIPFILMDRFGFAVMSGLKEDIQKALTWNYDYIVIQDRYLMQLINSYPEVINRVEKIAGNGKITLYKKDDSNPDKTLSEFMGFDTQPPVISKIISFDSLPENGWKNTRSMSLDQDTANYFGYVDENKKYGISLTLNNRDELTQKEHLLYFSARVFPLENLKNVFIVTMVKSDDEKVYYNSFRLDNYINTVNQWKDLNLLFLNIPKLKSDRNTMKVYLWNRGRKKMFYDDIRVEIY